MTYNRPEAAADALPLNILPAHACSHQCFWRRREVLVMMMSAEEWVPAASASIRRAYL